jgi:hypothetical protein
MGSQKIYLLEKDYITLVAVGQYYDEENMYLVGLDYPLSFLFDCEKRFRTALNCMAYVEKVLRNWVSSLSFEADLSRDDWDDLKERIEGPMLLGMNSGHYADVKKALKQPFKKIPKLLADAGSVSKPVYKFRLEKGI